MSKQTNQQKSIQTSNTTNVCAPQSFAAFTPTLVGVVGTAGSRQALDLLFRNLPDDSGMAFVVVVNLSARQISQLPALLQKRTNMPVVVAADGVPIQSDRVYVAPAEVQLLLKGNELQLRARQPQERTPSTADDATLGLIDRFLQSLATVYQAEAVAILLSGTGTDGIAGLKELQQAGGLTMVQDPEEAAHAALPRRAIKAGLATVVATAGEMARQLVQQRGVLAWGTGGGPLLLPENLEQFYSTVLTHILAHTGHDLSHYKVSTLHRRVARRMQIAGIHIHNTADYAELLRTTEAEAVALFQDSLVSVTSFFRDPDAYEMLEKDCIPQLFAEKMRHDYVRVWVAGCATGEEAYSVAMQLAEYAAQAHEPPRLQVFATDLDENAIAFARQGIYPLTIAKDISPSRLERFFLKDENGYQVRPEIREHVLFAVHDLLKDPPFSRLDLICCRNVLIYFNRDAQEKVFATFHYALSRSGYLFLGTSESVDSSPDLFAVLNKQCHLYQRRDVVSLPQRPLSASTFAMLGERTTARRNEDKALPNRTVEELYTSWSLRRHTPPRLLVNDTYEITHLFGAAGNYLEEREGAVTQHILQRILPDLRLDLRTSLYQAFSKGERTISRLLRVEVNGEPQLLQLEVGPVAEPGFPEGYAEVLFVAQDNLAMLERFATGETVETDLVLVKRMEEELMRTRERLQSIIEEYEESSQDLKTSNEELQSINEELKSTTEELETSKEELQSMNEELITVNGELNEKIDELHRANSDLLNFISSTDVGAIFLNMRLQITRFTPRATDLFNLIESDQGRPLSHVTHKIRHAGLVQLAEYIRESAKSVEETVQSEDGHWYILRLFPYRTVNDRFDGVVITFVDISDLKRAESEERQRHQQQALAELSRQALVGNDLDALFQTVAIQVAHVLDMEFCKLLTLQPDENSLLLKAGVGWHEGLVGTALVPIESGSQAGYTLRTQGPVVVRDLLTETRFYGPSLLTEHNVRSGISVTIFGVDGPFGVLGVHSSDPRNFAPYDVDFLQAVANTLAATIVRRHAANQLRESEAKLRRYVDMLQGSYDAVIVWSPQHGIEFWNRGAEVLYGYSSAEALGQTSHELLATQHPEPLSDIMALLQQGSTWEGELVHRTKNGRTVIVSTRHQFMTGNGGETVILEINRDVTDRKAAELALRRSEERYRYLFETMDEGFCVVEVLFDENGVAVDYRFIESNPAFEAFTGLEQAVGKTARELIPGLEAHWFEIYGNVAVTGEPIRFEQGSEAMGRWFTVYAFRVGEATSQRVAILFSNITERKRMEESLRASEIAARRHLDELEAIYNTAPIGLCVLDRDLRWIRINERMAEMNGFSAADHIGHTIRELLPDLADDSVPILQDILETGQSLINVEISGETPAQPGVHRTWVESWFPLYDREGRVAGINVVAEEITARKAAEAQLRYQAYLLENVQDAIISTDPEFRIRTWNSGAEQIYGWSADEAIGQPVRQLLRTIYPNTDITTILQLFQEEGQWQGEVTQSTKNGHVINISNVTKVLLDDVGNMIGTVAVNRDITVQKEVQRALAASEAKFATAFSSSPIILVITSLTTGELLEVNESFLQTSGYTREEALGRTTAELGLWIDEAARMDGIDRLRRGEAIRNSAVIFQVKDGSLRHCVLGATVVEIDGTPCILNALADISEQKQVEQALQASESQLTLITDNVSGLISYVDHTETYRFVNAVYEEWFAQTRQQIIGTTIRQQVDDDAYARVQPHVEQALRGERTSFENTVHYPDGNTRTVMATYVPDIDDNQVLGFYALVTDITERKLAEERLRFLAEASSLLATSLDVDVTLDNVAHAAVPGIADWCTIDLLDMGKIVGVTLAHVDPAKIQWAKALRERYPIDPNAAVGAPNVIRTGISEFYPVITDATLEAAANTEEELRLLHSVGYRSVMIVPLATHGATIGAITFVLTESERHFEQSDLAMAEELARRAAAAIGNAQLYRTLQSREQELRISEERFRAVQQATPDGFMIFESVRDEHATIVDFRWLYVNPAGEQITGRTNEYLVGKQLLEEMPGNRTEGIFDAYVSVVESGEVWQREFYYNHEGFNHWFLSTAAKAGDGFAVAFTDVTGNKQAEAALRTSEERFRSAFEQAAVGMAHLTVEGHYTRVNDRLCEILGYTREELLQKSFHEVTHPADLDADLAQMERQMAGEIIHHSMEKRYIRKDGSILWANMTASLVRDDAGQPLYGIVVIEDISSRKTAEAAIRELNATLEERISERTVELERSNHDLDQFAYVASHDLRAPLRGIDSLATWISEDAAALLPDASKAHLAKLRGRVERMERLLEDLLTYSRVGRRDGQAEMVETDALVRDIVDLMAAPAGFTVTITSAMPTIQTPRAPLELVFRNLIGNAIKHHHDPANGLIEISAKEQGDFVEFTVTDNGPGIEERHHARIFNMFQTLRPRDEMEGSGMGLAIVQRAVEFRRGQIRIESSPGNGATFIFTWAKSS